MLLNNFNCVKEQIKITALKYNRDPKDIKLLPVSKTKPLHMLEELVDSGVNLFGENYVKEAIEKKKYFDSLNKNIEFHLIGPLQTNKAKASVSTFTLIHSINSIKLAKEINKYSNLINKIQNILIQVNISKETSKSGVSVSELDDLAECILTLDNLKLDGLMMIGSFSNDEKIKEQEFMLLNSLARKLERKFSIKLKDLSMGMSDDFELAIKHGSTIVRVGSLIFGARLT